MVLQCCDYGCKASVRFDNGTQWFIQVGCLELICSSQLAEVVEGFPSLILLLWLVNADRVFNIVPSCHICTHVHTANCQCFQSLNCGGSVTVPGQSTLRDCCVNTDDGLTWRSGDGSCTNCIGKRNLTNS